MQEWKWTYDGGDGDHGAVKAETAVEAMAAAAEAWKGDWVDDEYDLDDDGIYWSDLTVYGDSGEMTMAFGLDADGSLYFPCAGVQVPSNGRQLGGRTDDEHKVVAILDK